MAPPSRPPTMYSSKLPICGFRPAAEVPLKVTVLALAAAELLAADKPSGQTATPREVVIEQVGASDAKDKPGEKLILLAEQQEEKPKKAEQPKEETPTTEEKEEKKAAILLQPGLQKKFQKTKNRIQVYF